MSAPVKMKNKKKNFVHKGMVKHVLLSPLELEWPMVDFDTTDEILQQMKRTLDSLSIGRQKIPHFRGKDKVEKKELFVEENKSQRTTEQRNIRSQLVAGVSSVTRSLEQGKLRLIIVNRNKTMQYLTQHLTTMSSMSGCPAICLSHFDETIKESLGFSCLTALGFKVTEPGDSDALDDLVDFISTRTPLIIVPGNMRTAIAENKLIKQDIGHDQITKSSIETDSQSIHMEEDEEEDEEDYSYLYVYKSDRTTVPLIKQNTSLKPLEFIPLSGTDATDTSSFNNEDFIPILKTEASPVLAANDDKNINERKRKRQKTLVDPSVSLYKITEIINITSNPDTVKKSTKVRKGKKFQKK